MHSMLALLVPSVAVKSSTSTPLLLAKVRARSIVSLVSAKPSGSPRPAVLVHTPWPDRHALAPEVAPGMQGFAGRRLHELHRPSPARQSVFCVQSLAVLMLHTLTLLTAYDTIAIRPEVMWTSVVAVTN